MKPISKIDLLLKEVGPHKRHEERCRRKLEAALQIIAHIPIDPAPGTTRKRLAAASKSLRSAHLDLERLPKHLVNLFDLTTLERMARQTGEMADQIEVKHTGNNRGDAMRKRVAAKLFFDVLMAFGRAPTLADKGRYIRLTREGYKAATSVRVADVSKACRAQFNALEKSGAIPSRASRKERSRPIDANNIPDWMFPDLLDR